VCGFSGFFSKSDLNYDPNAVLKTMGLAIKHRGPDSSGEWINNLNKVGFSHRRLAVVDLSVAGNQPMPSVSERYVIAFNGEIYNHLDLRAELEIESPDIVWRGHSDTETLLAGFDKWGVQETVEKCIGMFSFSVWDEIEKSLVLARDRLGEKPLYYGWHGATLLFGSELKALKAHPDFVSEIDRNSLTLLLRYNCIPAPYSIYKGIKKLLPGNLLKITNLGEELIEYWSARKVFENSKKLELKGGAEEAISELECLLKLSIKQQMISDVSLGAFLSGGIDSSTVVALMQSQSETPIKTFSIGFNEEGYNEAEHAKSVAMHLGTDHTELYVTSEEALAVIPKLADMYDEPFSDSSQIPTYLVSKMAKEHVTVALSGDGGDELFCGYNRYVLTDRVWRKLSRVPLFIRRNLGVLIRFIPVNYWNVISYIIPKKMKIINIGDKLHKAAGVIGAKTSTELYQGLTSHWSHPEEIVIDSNEPLTVINDFNRKPNLSNDIEQMMALDTITYLPDDILTKVDRAAMYNSLETRVPFLNHKVVEFAWSLPLGYKLKGGVGKWCLKQVLFKHVPKSLIERPKMGFGVPIDTWLRGPLKEWANELLAEDRLINEGFFKPEKIRTMWDEHQTGKRNWQYQLWDILMFQSWYEKNK